MPLLARYNTSLDILHISASLSDRILRIRLLMRYVINDPLYNATKKISDAIRARLLESSPHYFTGFKKTKVIEDNKTCSICKKSDILVENTQNTSCCKHIVCKDCSKQSMDKMETIVRFMKEIQKTLKESKKQPSFIKMVSYRAFIFDIIRRDMIKANINPIITIDMKVLFDSLINNQENPNEEIRKQLEQQIGQFAKDLIAVVDDCMKCPNCGCSEYDFNEIQE